MNKKIVLITDFDGTITKQDFFYYVIDNLLTKQDLKPWDDYISGEINHVEALSRIFSKIRMSEKDFHDFILGLPIEEDFVQTVEFCNAHNTDIFIVSAGCDYYINIILENLGVKEKLILLTNKGFYTPETGLTIKSLPKEHPYYSANFGIDKKIAVKDISSKYDISLFAGDGKPDFKAAGIASVTFARDVLLRLCTENNIPTREFTSYKDILDCIKNV